MTVRLFRCKHCGHKMRFAGNRCGYCYRPKSAFQNSVLVCLLAALPITLGLFLAAMT
ncbi:hypothetical protein [Actibacterium sp. D379-3]